MPAQLLGYVEKYGKLPVHLTFSIASLMAFYTGSEIRDKALIGHRNGQEYNIMDDAAVLEFSATTAAGIQRLLWRRTFPMKISMGRI